MITHTRSRVLLALVLLGLAASAARSPGWWCVLLAASALALAAPQRSKSLAAPILATCVLALGILLSPLSSANHHYLMTYMALAFALSVGGDKERSRAILSRGASGLLIALMMIAGVQKALSPSFLDGSFLLVLFAEGEFATWLWHAVDFTNEARGELERFRSPREPDHLLSLRARAIPMWALTMSKVMALVTIFIEVGIAIVFLAARWRASLANLAHGSLLLFGVGLLLIRAEYVFSSALLWLGIASALDQPLHRVLVRGYWMLFGVAMFMVCWRHIVSP